MPDSHLESLLLGTRDALLSGDLSRLGALSEETEQALAAGVPPDAAEAERLRALAERNRPLLAAAIRGVKAAQRRAAEVAGHGSFVTYDARGNRDILGRAPAAPVRRA
ncbi:hypothetical protein LHP98_07410 [Rhodobacter sp. Har01]|uniref:hypothetical protein n=1 Tax=Rhodobacter sp. Har01 TaxID=2883999 RepID=UPI001D079791|nr:hypothetical protein [Rhodobacter sp. Har01]MCB6177957.1 hypothetical protein [Rhodobacter sp. Har01]